MRRAVAALACVALFACAREPDLRATPAPSIGTREVTFVDPDRTTDPTPGEPGDEQRQRTLRTSIWFPADGSDREAVADGRFPIVLFSHGLGVDPKEYDGLISAWVSEGYVVVAPSYPLTHAAINPRTPFDVVHQSLDATFVLTSLTELVDGDDPLSGHLDLSKVVAAGHSLGGMTTYGLFQRCCRDRRIDAGIVLGGNDLGFRNQQYSSKAPLLFAHGEKDTIITIGTAKKAYERAPVAKAFVTLLGAGHVTPYLRPSDEHFDVVAESTIDFMRWVLTDDRNALNALRSSADDGDLATLKDELE